MATLSQQAFLDTLPQVLIAHLPEPLQGFQVRRPWRYLLQIHYGEPALHYEVSRLGPHPDRRVQGWELGLHFESRNSELNRLLLRGFLHHLVEIRHTLGDGIEAEMWDRGWTKVYEVFAEGDLTTAYQQRLGRRLAAIIACLQPIFVELRGVPQDGEGLWR